MKKFKLLIATVVIGSIFSTAMGNTLVYANQEVSEEKGIDLGIEKRRIKSIDKTTGSKAILKDINEATATKIDKLTINETTIDLYAEYEDQEKALQAFKDEFNEELTFVKNNLGLEDITNDNWRDYYNSINNLVDSLYEQEIPGNVLNNQHAMLCFFDIYENYDKNIEIKTLNKKIDSSKESLIKYNKNLKGDTISQENYEALVEIDLLLPIDAPKLTTVQFNPELKSVQPDSVTTYATGTPGIFLDNAIAYAAKYADSPNDSEYGDLTSKGGDCTNFVSQILKAGGVSEIGGFDPLNPNDCKLTGWWHDKVLMINQYSRSWSHADTFARYMGIGKRYDDHLAFSKDVQKGDVIGYDRARDRDINHMAFVTDKDPNIGTYWDSKEQTSWETYYDYKVAQHTNNYHAWVSGGGSYANGWENLDDQNGMPEIDWTDGNPNVEYMIVRRVVK